MFRTKSIRIAASRFRLPDKEKPRSSEATRLRGLFEPQGSAGLEVGTKGRRSLLRCRRFECHIECDNCLLDLRLTDPSFSAKAPRQPLARPLARASAPGIPSRREGAARWPPAVTRKVTPRPATANRCPDNSLILLARSEGFEPPTPRFEVWCSIQLSYERRRLSNQERR